MTPETLTTSGSVAGTQRLALVALEMNALRSSGQTTSQALITVLREFLSTKSMSTSARSEGEGALAANATQLRLP